MDYFWDTTLSPDQYPEEIKKIYYNETILNRKSYTLWIGELSKKYCQDLDWWTTNIVTRNPYISSLYKNICLIETIKKLLKKNIKLNLIVNNDLGLVIKNNLKKEIKISLKNYNKSNNFFSNLFIFIKSIVFQILIFFFIKLFIKKKKIHKIITIINTYPTQDVLFPERLFRFEKKNDIKEDKKINNIYFAPTFIISNKIFRIFKAINNLEEKKYIFKEHYIPFKEFFYILLNFIRCIKFTGNFKKYKNFDYSHLVNKEIKSLSNYFSRVNCLINYYFVKNLKKHKINIKKGICWLENQPDKLWCLGLNKFYKSSLLIGYQGFNNLPQLMNTIPAKYEKKYNLLPDTIMTIGKAYLKSRREFFKDLNLKVGPALVYQEALKKRKKIKKNIKFLVILCDFDEINKVLINLLKKNKFLFKEKKVLIKLPKIPNKKNLQFLKELPNNFIFTSYDLTKLMMKSENVICSDLTSTYLECLIHNCRIILPNINVPNEYFLKKIKIPTNIFFTANTNLEFINIIKKLDNPQRKQLFYSKRFINKLFNSDKKNEKLFF